MNCIAAAVLALTAQAAFANTVSLIPGDIVSHDAVLSGTVSQLKSNARWSLETARVDFGHVSIPADAKAGPDGVVHVSDLQGSQNIGVYRGFIQQYQPTEDVFSSNLIQTPKFEIINATTATPRVTDPTIIDMTFPVITGDTVGADLGELRIALSSVHTAGIVAPVPGKSDEFDAVGFVPDAAYLMDYPSVTVTPTDGSGELDMALVNEKVHQWAAAGNAGARGLSKPFPSGLSMAQQGATMATFMNPAARVFVGSRDIYGDNVQSNLKDAIVQGMEAHMNKEPTHFYAGNIGAVSVEPAQVAWKAAPPTEMPWAAPITVRVSYN
ncbi:hypothetical protein B0T45_22675 [Chromobacterium haemolyticum]|uniref:Fimbrial protein n=2 Tax=Chromobacterium haemolyticum TaxID=394935 RepID=A0A1W0CAA3_9NEIS|nr:hypothetical protein B0T45_22665 [Chromobacterium haemolyticum]OQS31671.1 hypothetical protein B0T45_22675 [Chromobacterium haemolyticum]